MSEEWLWLWPWWRRIELLRKSASTSSQTLSQQLACLHHKDTFTVSSDQGKSSPQRVDPVSQRQPQNMGYELLGTGVSGMLKLINNVLEFPAKPTRYLWQLLHKCRWNETLYIVFNSPYRHILTALHAGLRPPPSSHTPSSNVHTQTHAHTCTM